MDGSKGGRKEGRVREGGGRDGGRRGPAEALQEGP